MSSSQCCKEWTITPGELTTFPSFNWQIGTEQIRDVLQTQCSFVTLYQQEHHVHITNMHTLPAYTDMDNVCRKPHHLH